MTRGKSLAIVTLLWAFSLNAADPKWIQIKSDHFQVYSSAKERETRDFVNHLERVYDFFVQFTKSKPPNELPVHVVIFGSEKEYKPFRINDFAIAYYSGQADRDYIVVGKFGNEANHTAAHEYTHLFFRHANYNLPPWLNEGIAELFSTLKVSGKNIQFGDVIPGRILEMQRERWVPLQTIIAADRDSSYYNEGKQAGSLYNQGWALVHMLATTEEYRPNFLPLLEAVRAGTPSLDALQSLYGPLNKIEENLEFYIKSSRYNLLTTPMKLVEKAELPATPLDTYTVRLLEADLQAGRADTQEDARQRYEELAKEDPTNPGPWSGLAYLDLRAGKREQAIADFTKAYQLGGRNPKMLYDFGRFGMGQPLALDAFRDYVKLDPENGDAKLDFATALAGSQLYAEAHAVAKSVGSVRTTAQRDRVLYIRAFSAIQSGDPDDARKMAEELQALTTDATYKERAEQLLRALAPNTRVVVAPRNEIASSDPQLLIRRPTPPEDPTTDRSMILETANGTFLEMDCKDPARIILQTEEGLMDFVIEDPNRLIVRAANPGRVQLNCGKQSGAQKLSIQYTDPPEGSKVSGIVRVVTFPDN